MLYVVLKLYPGTGNETLRPKFFSFQPFVPNRKLGRATAAANDKPSNIEHCRGLTEVWKESEAAAVQEKDARSPAILGNDLNTAFCLLYIPKNEENYANIRSGGIDAYLYCASYLRWSLEQIKIELTILTNDKEFIVRHCPLLKRANIIELEFLLDVPEDVKFRSAHYKIEVINYIGQMYLHGKFLLVDVDVVCANARAGQFLRELASRNEACALDLSDQVYAAYGQERVDSDIRLLSGGQLAIWFGGEFLLGTPSFFRRLAQVMSSIWPNYIARRHGLHHQGDEAVVSAALCKMLERNEPITCVPPGRLILRWWNTITAHRQVGLVRAMKTGLLHLPSDKNFIVFCAKVGINPRYFPALYFIYASMQMPVHFVRATFNLLRHKDRTSHTRLFGAGKSDKRPWQFSS